MALIGTAVPRNSAFEQNDQHTHALLARLQALSEQTMAGGGKAATEKHRKKGKLT